MRRKSFVFLVLVLCLSLNAISATNGPVSADRWSTSAQLVPPTESDPDDDGEGGVDDEPSDGEEE